VVQTPFPGGTDVHTGALTNGFEPFEDLDGISAVLVVLLVLAGGHGRKVLLGFAGANGTPRGDSSQSTGKRGQDRFSGGVSAYLIGPCTEFFGLARVGRP
jgi:hypothetical protein